MASGTTGIIIPLWRLIDKNPNNFKRIGFTLLCPHTGRRLAQGWRSWRRQTAVCPARAPRPSSPADFTPPYAATTTLMHKFDPGASLRPLTITGCPPLTVHLNKSLTSKA